MNQKTNKSDNENIDSTDLVIPQEPETTSYYGPEDETEKLEKEIIENNE